MASKFEYPVAKVFAAAVRAFNANNGYFKTDSTERIQNENNEEILVRKPRNLSLMTEYLSAPNDPCTPDEYAQANNIIAYYQSKLLDLMTGKLNSYSQAACQAANAETIKELVTVGLIASLPKAYLSSVKFDNILEAKEKAFSTSSHFGKKGDTFQGRATIISSIYSQKWFRYFHTAQDINTGNVINFSTDTELEIGKEMQVKGRIKDHVENNVTRLNYVKITS
jgi:hypothetical protein